MTCMSVVKTFAAAAVLAVATSSSALALSCPPTAEGAVLQNTILPPTTAVAQCDMGTDDNDSVSQVNSDAMFTLADWDFAGKEEFSKFESGIDVGFTVTGDGVSGTWSFASDVFSRFTAVMIVLKGSNAPGTTPEEYVGYLLSSAFLPSGTYTTPFLKDGKAQDISHISAYVSGPTVVPLPAALWLLLGVSGALVVAKRRSARMAA